MIATFPSSVLRMFPRGQFHTWRKQLLAQAGIGLAVRSSSSSTALTKSNGKKTFRPRRAVMYVPGSDERKIKKIPNLNADCIVLDFEDGVAVSKKNEARALVRKILDENNIDFGRSERTVRVNATVSGLCEEDLKSVLSAKHLPTTIHLPKVDSLDDVKYFLDKSAPALANRELQEKINLLMLIESPIAILSLVDIVKGTIQMCKNSKFVLDGLIFGSDDYCASIGATRTNEGHEVAYPRQYLVTVAKAFQLQCIDIVFIDFKDQNGFIKQAMEAAAMGYTGKQIIHPVQVSVCHEAFSPPPDKIDWARELIKEFNKHQESGQGAFRFRECMIDMPLLRQAQNIVDLANALELSTKNSSSSNKNRDSS